MKSWKLERKLKKENPNLKTVQAYNLRKEFQNFGINQVIRLKNILKNG